MNSINNIIKEEVLVIKPSLEIIKNIKSISKKFISELEGKLKKKKIKAEVFIGGSLAKNTLAKTDDNKYDVDIFVRFDKKYDDEEISELLGKVIGKKAKKIHGSRDYYQISMNKMILEVIPVSKILKPEQARNVTDLSYFHVNYVLNKINKKKELANEIIVTKAFAHAQNCYGAESYIHGFSGYSIELLILHYKSFLNFIRQVAKSVSKLNEKLIIDDEIFYRNNKDVLIEMNESKLSSPIILVDPTFKHRNALSGLSAETFEKFRKACIEFLKKPSSEFFRKKSAYDEFRGNKNLKIISIKTNKQAGDISGTKSKKFLDFFISQAEREFIIKRHGFDYDEKRNIAYYYLILEKKPDETIQGPPIIRVDNLTKFKKTHLDAFVKNGIAYAHLSHKQDFESWLKYFLGKYKKVISEMSIKEIKGMNQKV